MAKPKKIDKKTGEIVDNDPLGVNDDEELDDDMEIHDEPERDSQAKVVAELTGIVLKPSQRTYTLKVSSKAMREQITELFQHQKDFMLKFKVPVQKENGEVTKWKEVEFLTKLVSVSLKGDSATCQGHITHEGAEAMSKLVTNWKDGIQFFLDGVQQSLFGRDE